MSSVTFPSFAVVDGSWGPCMLSISNLTGMSILSSKTGDTLENWPWHEFSHATIKNKSVELVQMKKLNEVRKLVTFPTAPALERFELVLKNAVSILSLWNIKRQRKFLVIQASTTTCAVREISMLDVNSNVMVQFPKAFIPLPPPPPPPMAALKPVATVQSKAIPKQVVVPANQECLTELREMFAKGFIMPSEQKITRAQQAKSIVKDN